MTTRILATISLLLGLVAGAHAEDLLPAQDVYRQMEQRLLQAKQFSIQFEVSSEGVYPASFVGELSASQPDYVAMQSKGHFNHEQMELLLTAVEGRMEGGRVGSLLPDVEGRAVWEAMVLGMTRMGLLHNHARLSSGSLPDHAETGIGDWLEVVNVRWSERAAEQKDAWRALEFDLWVDGTDAADVVLWLDDGAMPLYREQTVYFDGGSMTVGERTHVEIRDPQATCAPCRQELAPFGHRLYVENGFERIYVCCSGCAAKTSRDWDGYRAILMELGEDTERLHRQVEGPIVVNPLDKGVCVACLGGRCELPEHLPGGKNLE